ncbi:Peroxisomal membrane protein PEX14, partial [Mucuna pruriens]
MVCGESEKEVGKNFEILERFRIAAMVQRGEKTSNTRDIYDLPPNPSQQPSNPRLVPRSKPWEVGQVQSTSTQMLQSQVNGEDLNMKARDSPLLNGDDPLPWWQRKNVRIREIDDENESNGVPYAAASSHQAVQQRVWVPPQPPPIVMAEAAEAIRRPKPVVQKEQMSVAQSSDGSDDMHGVPSEGAVESSKSGEIQEEHEVKYDDK